MKKKLFVCLSLLVSYAFLPAANASVLCATSGEASNGPSPALSESEVKAMIPAIAVKEKLKARSAEDASKAATPSADPERLTLSIVRQGWGSSGMTLANAQPIRAKLEAAGIPIVEIDLVRRKIEVLATNDQLDFLRSLERVSAIWDERRTINYKLPKPGELSPEEIARRKSQSAFELEANDPSRMSWALRERIQKGDNEIEIWVMLLDGSYRAEYIEFLSFLSEYGIIQFESPLNIFAGIKFSAYASPEAIAEIASWEPKVGRPDGKIIQYMDVLKGEMAKQFSEWARRQQ